MTYDTAICCPEFHPEKWDEKTFYWDNKSFIKETIPTFFHIPFPPMIGKKITKMVKLAEVSNMMLPDKEDMLVLFADPTPFKSEIYLSVTGNVPGATNTGLSGTFMSKVFDGGYNAIPTFIKQMNGYLAEKNITAKKQYVHYAYCPGCAKKYGKNHMILFAET
ncbi:MAG: hydrolase [Candidatus Paceibacterota bacterium]|jgi:hypothetical protein